MNLWVATRDRPERGEKPVPPTKRAQPMTELRGGGWHIVSRSTADGPPSDLGLFVVVLEPE